MASKPRIGYIDIAKCIAIAFIIIGHMGLVFSSVQNAGGMPPEIVHFAFSFHLFVFFVASGYFFSESKAFSSEFLKKDIISLLVPYAVTALLIIAGCSIMALYQGQDAILALKTWTKAAIWGAGDTSQVSLWPNVARIGGIWFLWAMFWAHMLLVATHKLNDWARLLTLSLCAAIAVISARYVWLPFSIQSGLGCAIFLYVGMLARKHTVFEKGGIPAVVMILLVAMWFYVIKFGGCESVAMQIYPLGAIDILGGIAATAVIMVGSRKIEEHTNLISKFMQWIGRNTLVIFCLHIVEDNVLPWIEISNRFSVLTGGWEGTWILVLLMRFALDAFLVALMYVTPKLRLVYFPQLKKIQGDEEAELADKKIRKKSAIGVVIAAFLMAVVFVAMRLF